MSRTVFLMGLTKQEELAFAEFEVTTRNGYNEFTACFDTVTTLFVDDDVREEQVESILDCYEKEDLYNLCERYDCSPRELSEECIKDWTDEELFDTYSQLNSIELDDDELIIFTNCSGGQHDVRKDGGFVWQVNEELNNKVLELWDNYHLKEVSDDVINTVNELIQQAKQIDADHIVEDYVKELYSDKF